MSSHPFSRCPLHLAFYCGRDHGRLLDRLIAHHDDGPYSHVELVFSSLPRVGSVICFSSSFRDGGVRFKRITLGGAKGVERWDLLAVPIAPREVADLRAWCLPKLGGRYDLPGVIAFKLPFVRQKLGWWFCSEICAAALQTFGYLPGLRPESLSPNGLYRAMRREGAWTQA